MSFIKHDSNKIAAIGLVGMLLSLSAFFVALFMKDTLSAVQLLIYPVSLLTGLFFFGYFRSGTIIGAIKDTLIIFVLIVVYIVLKKLSTIIEIFK